MAMFEVIEHEAQKMIRVTLEGDTVRAESGALHYYKGQVTMTSSTPTASGVLGSLLSGETIFRPTYTGVGEVVFGPPIFGEYVILDLQGESWILDRGAYVCSEEGIEVSSQSNKLGAAVLGGEGIFQTKVSGYGKVVIEAPGRVDQVSLTNDTLAVDGRFAVARTGNIDFSVKRATKSMLGSVTSGEGLVNVFTGSGLVLLAPVPNMYVSLARLVRVLPVGSTATSAAGPFGGALGELLTPTNIIGGLVAVFVFICLGCGGILGLDVGG